MTLALWDDAAFGDDRPLPEVIAEQYGFPLQYVDDAGARFYAVQDWIRGVAQVDDARNILTKLKKRAPELLPSWLQFPYKAANGRMYRMDYAPAEGLYAVTQRMDASTGLRSKVLAFLAKAGVIADEIRRDPEGAIAAITDYSDSKEYRRLIDSGMTPAEAVQWLDTRGKQRSGRNQITASWKARGASGRDYAKLTNAVTASATGKTATELKRELAVSNPRDHLSAAENAAISGVELFAGILHTSNDSRGADALAADIADSAAFINLDAIKRAFSKKRATGT